MEISELMENFE